MATTAQPGHRPDRDDDRLDRPRHCCCATSSSTSSAARPARCREYVAQRAHGLRPRSTCPTRRSRSWSSRSSRSAVTCIALMRTRLGKAMRAVSDNPALSASSGMRVDGVISSVWILGAALTGLSGVLLAVNSQVNFHDGLQAAAPGVRRASPSVASAPSGARSSAR